MKNLLIGLAAFAALACMAAPASADQWYVKAEVGTTVGMEAETSWGAIELSDELTFGGYVGTAVGPFRIEAGVAHLSGNTSFGLEGSAIDYNATAYLDTASGFYVGAGVDYIQAEAQIGPWFSADASGYGYHGSAGYATNAAGGIVEFQATWLEADLGDVDLTGPRFTVGYRHAL